MNRILICMTLVSGCGGDGNDFAGSGVDPGLALADLVSGDIETVCNYGEVVGMPHTVDCDGVEVMSNIDVNVCVDLLEAMPDTCPATVDDMEACMEALATQSDAEVCGLEAPASCDFLGDPACVDI